MSDKIKIKVVQIIADSDLGGGPTHVFNLLKNLDKDKFACFLICPTGDLSAQAKELAGVEVYNVEMKSKHDLKAFFVIREILHKIQANGYPFSPMLAHFHGARAGFLGRLIMPRHIINVYTEHSLDENYHLSNRFNEWIQKKTLARLNDRTDLVIAVSSSVSEYLIKKKLAPKNRTIVIPNGVDLSQLGGSAPKHKIIAEERAPIIGVVGSLNRQKSIHYLIDAMPMILKHFPLCTLEIIGDGPERENLKLRVKSRNLIRHVSFLGQKKDIYQYLKHWTVFALPSISETFGIVILEAMKMGIPVVASRVGGIKDIITDGKDGLLVKVRDPKALADAIIKILNNPVLAAKLKKNGLERVEDFDWKKIIKKIETAYSDLAKRIK